MPEGKYAPLLRKLGFQKVGKDRDDKPALFEEYDPPAVYMTVIGLVSMTLVTDERGQEWQLGKELDMSIYGFENIWKFKDRMKRFEAFLNQ